MKQKFMDTEKFLSYSIGFVFVLFGGLKLLGEISIRELVAETILFVPVEIFLPVLAVWEIGIGICFLYRPMKRVGLFLLLPHMAGTFMPFLVAPEMVFTSSGLTVKGHYIVKNLVLVAAAFQVQDDEFLDGLKEWLER